MSPTADDDPVPSGADRVDAESIVGDLVDAVGPDDVLLDDDVKAGYETDWTGRYGTSCLAVIRPRTTDQVARALAACRRHGVAVIPQGGNTGLVGGSVGRPGTGPTVILSTQGLDEVGEVDTASMQVTLGAAVTLAEWRSAARSAGLDTPVDFAARDSATIGGAIATNAGGSRVVRFGTMRHQVVGIEAVLVDGTVVGSLSGLPKETAGLHWPSLIAGSEGTLAVVTRARLRLVPWFRRTVTAMVSLPSIDEAISLLDALRANVPSLDAVELIQPAAYDLVTAHLGRSGPIERPGDGGSIVVVECAAHHDPTDELLAVLADVEVLDSALATDPGPRDALLDVRDRITESIAAASTDIGTPTFKLDVAVPLPRLAELLALAREAALDDGCRLIPFGHLAEGNVHLNHLGANDPERIAGRVLDGVAELGGTISAEHGIGVAKARYLGLIRTGGDLRAQRAIKAALDPAGILNPGVLLDPGVLLAADAARGSSQVP